MALISIWLKKSIWIWGSFGMIALILGGSCALIKPIAFLPMLFLMILAWGLQFNVQGFARFLIVSTAFLTGGGLFFSLLPGFSPPMTLSYPPLCISFGRAFIGLILTGTVVSTLTFKWSKEWNIVCSCALMSAIVFFLMMILWNPTLWKPYLSLSYFPWAGLTLFFTVLPEEVLLRGLLQKECTAWLGGGIKAQVFSVGILTMIYPLFHLSWAGNLSLLLPTFVIGLTLACLYQITRMIETAILTHLFFLSIHFCFFEKLIFWQQLPCIGLGL